MPLSIHNISNIFLSLQKQRNRASDCPPFDRKDHHIQSSSGDEPLTHPDLTSQAVITNGPHLSTDELFICADGVDVPRLLKVTRSTLYDKAQTLGGNALINEEYACPRLHLQISHPYSTFRWSCTICGPKHRRNGNFHVKACRSTNYRSLFLTVYISIRSITTPSCPVRK